MALFNKYIWLIKTIRQYGRLSLKELNGHWMETEMSRGIPIPRQTFDRWKNGIMETFGILLECDRKDSYRYYIANPEVFEENEVSNWVLNKFSEEDIIHK